MLESELIDYLETLNPKERRALYDLIQSEYVIQDVINRLDERGLEYTDEQLKRVVYRYVYGAENDANLSYWENIDTLINDVIVDLEVYNTPKLNDEQRSEIYKGIKSGVNVSLYSSPEFTSGQMYLIRIGLEHKLDVSHYAKPEFSFAQMSEIKNGLAEGVNVSLYAKKEFTPDQMELLKEGLIDGIDISLVANPELSLPEMEEQMDKLYERAAGIEQLNIVVTAAEIEDSINNLNPESYDVDSDDPGDDDI